MADGDGTAAMREHADLSSALAPALPLMGLVPTAPTFGFQPAEAPASLVIVCGMSAEVKIAAGPGIVVLKGGGDSARLAAELEAAASQARALVSFGVAGGLAPGLRPGDMQVANMIVTPDGAHFATDAAWSEAIAEILNVPLSTFVGVDRPLADIAGKAEAHRTTGATTVDMESHIVAQVAARHGLPFAAVRVITDAADQALPHAATVGMRSDGSVDLQAILRSLVKNPRQLPALIRTGLDAKAAFASLFRCRQLLGPGFARVDLVEPGLHVA